ncbi:MAG: hypothetical protein ACRELX_02725, partial [Longimicrobiales bacterium]
MLDADGQALKEELHELFRRPVDSPVPDDEFAELAGRVFGYQFGRNAPFAAFCHHRGRTPESIIGWLDIPAVPTAAFKEVPLVAGDPATAEATFRTSGTTRRRRGTHVILDLSLYHGALVPVFRAYLLPDGLKPAILSLIPPDQDLA